MSIPLLRCCKSLYPCIFLFPWFLSTLSAHDLTRIPPYRLLYLHVQLRPSSYPFVYDRNCQRTCIDSLTYLAPSHSKELTDTTKTSTTTVFKHTSPAITIRGT
ncbi:hypothetical protein V8F20_009220 [Naviculisporaceae sp. PSN 640]